MKINFIDLVQGINEDGNEYGYAGIEGRGGMFWTWHPTIEETLATLEDDTEDSPDNWPAEAYTNIRGIIRRNNRRVADRPQHMFGKSMVEV